MERTIFRLASIAASPAAILLAAAAFAQDQPKPLTGEAAFGDWKTDKPGVRRLLKPEDMVGVAVAKDGSLIVTEDGSGTIWRVSHEDARS